MDKKSLFSVKVADINLFNSDNDVQALGFALSLHQSSNASHVIKVFKDDCLIATLALA